MAGASGTYVDAKKAFEIGMVPPRVKSIYQIGNTSLSMARDIVTDPDQLERLQDLAKSLRANHCMFAESDAFQKAYLLELSYWGEGMPWDEYKRFLKLYGLPALPSRTMDVAVKHVVQRDIADLGKRGLSVIEQVGLEVVHAFPDCTSCEECIKACPERALSAARTEDTFSLRLRMDRCCGTACIRCERACPQAKFKFIDLCHQALMAKKEEP